VKEPGHESEGLLRSLEKASPGDWPAPWDRGGNLPDSVRPLVDSAVLTEIRRAQFRVASQRKRRQGTWLAIAAVIPLALGLYLFFRGGSENSGVTITDSIGSTRAKGMVTSNSDFKLAQGDALQMEIPGSGKAVVVTGPAAIQITKKGEELEFLVDHGQLMLMSGKPGSGERIAFISGGIRLVPVGTAGMLDVRGQNISLTVTEGEFEVQFQDGRSPERIVAGKTWSYSSGREEIKDAAKSDVMAVNSSQNEWRKGAPLTRIADPPESEPAPVDALESIRKTYGSVQRLQLQDGRVIFGYVELITRDSLTIITPEGTLQFARKDVESMKDSQ